MNEKALEYLGSYFLKDIKERIYFLHIDYPFRDILVSIDNYNLNIKILKKYDRVFNFMDKDCFYYIFSKDINFTYNWNNFIDSLEKWIQLKESE